ncbi:type IV conjugative transfer system coupling protein TraD [Endothiovibrio diazotrophicus]
MSHPIEALLRPPVEYLPAGAALFGATLAAAAPDLFMMAPPVAWGVATVLVGKAVYWWHRGRRVTRYHQGLRLLPRYALTAAQVPVSRRRLFLGRGFAWRQCHTQRLADCGRPGADRYLRMPWPYRTARRLAVDLEQQGWVGGALAGVLEAPRWLGLPNPVAPLPEVGGLPHLHGVGLLEGEESVALSLGERAGHTLVLGTTRVGKTRLMEILVTQDIARGDTVIVVDPKGDADLLRRVYAEAKRAGREEQLYLFHLGYPAISARYNPVGQFMRITEVPSRVAGQLPGEGQSATFREFVWRYVNVIAKALQALGRKVDYLQLKRFGENVEPLVMDYLADLFERTPEAGDWRAEVERLKARFADKEDRDKVVPRKYQSRDLASIARVDYYRTLVERHPAVYDDVAASLVKTWDYDEAFFSKLVASLLPFLEKMTSGNVVELLSPDYRDLDDPRPIFDWATVLRTGGIVYVGLDALSDPEVAAAVGNSMLADLTSTAGQIYKEGVEHGLPGARAASRRVCLHFDEVNELMGKEFVPLVNKAGGAGYLVTAYTQTLSDIEAKLGDRAMAGQVQGNFNTLIMLRVQEEATARYLTDRLPQVEINALMLQTGATDSSDPASGTDFTSSTAERMSTQMVPMLEPNHLVQLPKGQAFALLHGGALHKLRLPLPVVDDDGLPAELDAIAEEMAARYRGRDDRSWYRFRSSIDLEAVREAYRSMPDGIEGVDGLDRADGTGETDEEAA